MKKADNNKDFAKQKILEASDTTGVDFDISDRSEINRRIADRLQAPDLSQETIAVAAGGGQVQNSRGRQQSLFTVIVAVCALVIAAIFFIAQPIINATITSGGKYYGTEVTAEELISKYPEVLFPVSADYTISKIVLFRHETETESSIVEISITSADSRVDEIIFVIKLTANASVPWICSFSGLEESVEIGEIQVSYRINESSARAKFSVTPYEYYLIYDSEAPEGILNLISDILG